MFFYDLIFFTPSSDILMRSTLSSEEIKHITTIANTCSIHSLCIPLQAALLISPLILLSGIQVHKTFWDCRNMLMVCLMPFIPFFCFNMWKKSVLKHWAIRNLLKLKMLKKLYGMAFSNWLAEKLM